MELCVTALNPAPPGAVASTIRTTDNVGLARRALARAAALRRHGRHFPGPRRIHRKIFRGRSRIARAKLRRRDSGLARAGRLRTAGPGPRQRPCRAFFRLSARPRRACGGRSSNPCAGRPFSRLAHSMAGAMLLEQARAGRSAFERIVLTAPMIDLYRLPVRAGSRMGLCPSSARSASDAPSRRAMAAQRPISRALFQAMC